MRRPRDRRVPGEHRRTVLTVAAVLSLAVLQWPQTAAAGDASLAGRPGESAAAREDADRIGADEAAALGVWRLDLIGDAAVRYRPTITIERRRGRLAATAVLYGQAFSADTVTIDAGRIEMSITTEYAGSAVHSTLRGAIADGRMSGGIDYDLYGMPGRFDFTAEQIAPPGGLEALAGRWRVHFALPGLDADEAELWLAVEDERLVGHFTCFRRRVPVPDLAFRSGQLIWSHRAEEDDPPAILTYRARPAEQQLTGVVEYRHDREVAAADLTGRRLEPAGTDE